MNTKQFGFKTTDLKQNCTLALEDLEFQDHQASSFQTLVYLLAVWTKLMFQNQVGEHQEK